MDRYGQLIVDSGSETQFYKLVKKFMEGVRNAKKIEDLQSKFEKFKEKSDVEEMFRCLWESRQAHRYLSYALPPVPKCEENAVKLKIKGDNYFLKKKLSKALKCYNSIIINSNHPEIDLFKEENNIKKKYEDGSLNENNPFRTLSMAYAARSLVLYELRLYEKCISDIDRALALGFPHFVMNTEEKQRLEKEILLTKDNAALKLNDVETEKSNGLNENNCEDENISEKSEITETEINNSNINNNKSYSDDDKKYVEANSGEENDMVYSNKVQETCLGINNDELIFGYRSPSPPKLESFNPSIPCLNEALNMQYSPEKGRFIVANRDIMPGELLAVDKGFVSCINLMDPDVGLNFCCLCFSRAPAPLPCPECNMVVFCSEECRLLGLQKFHWVECPSLTTLADLGHTACLIKTHRIITQTTYPILLKMLPQVKQQVQDKSRQEQGVNQNGIYDSSDYESVYSLEENLTTRSVSELIYLSAGAFIIVKLLLRSERYFLDDNGQPFEPTEEEIIQLGAVCINHISSTLCNSSAIGESQINNNQSDMEHDLLKIGTGIYPSIALINHSCCPTAVVYSYKNVDVCHAISFIPSGQEITISYGHNYGEEDTETRRTNLSNVYKFHCHCDACSSSWVLNDSDPAIKEVCDEGTCMHNLSKSDLANQLEDITNKYHNIKEKFINDDSEPEELISILINLLVFLERYTKQPNLLHFQAQKLLCDYFQGKGSCNVL